MFSDGDLVYFYTQYLQCKRINSEMTNLLSKHYLTWGTSSYIAVIYFSVFSLNCDIYTELLVSSFYRPCRPFIERNEAKYHIMHRRSKHYSLLYSAFSVPQNIWPLHVASSLSLTGVQLCVTAISNFSFEDHFLTLFWRVCQKINNKWVTDPRQQTTPEYTHTESSL